MIAGYDDFFHFSSPTENDVLSFYKIIHYVNKKTLHKWHICVKNVHAGLIKSILQSSSD